MATSLKTEITETFAGKENDVSVAATPLPKPLSSDVSQEELNSMGYMFTPSGVLAQKENAEEGFKWEGQEKYEQLGDTIGRFIMDAMVKQYGFHKHLIPDDDHVPAAFLEKYEGHTIKTSIFTSPDYETKNVICLLIQGSGVVRPGQWARSVIINDCLGAGACFNYIQKMLDRDWGIVVLNPNESHVDIGEKKLIPIPKNFNRSAHGKYVYDNFVSTNRINSSCDIVIVAHSAGGDCTLSILREYPECRDRCKGIAFTDSVHGTDFSDRIIGQHLSKKARNWIRSEEPLDTPHEKVNRCKFTDCVSAGHDKHVYTSATSIESVFTFLDEKLENKTTEEENGKN